MRAPNLVYQHQGRFRTIAIYATAQGLKVGGGGGGGVNAGCTSDFVLKHILYVCSLLH